MSRRVSIVVDPGYGERLARLAMTSPVWIVESEANRRAAEDAWLKAQEWPHIDVTVFRANVPLNSAEEWRHVLDQVTLHAPSMPENIDVIGAELTDAARDAFKSLDYGLFALTKAGFRATGVRGR